MRLAEFTRPQDAGRRIRRRLEIGRKFFYFPNPNGDFAPCPALEPLQQIRVTRYGYVSTGSKPQFLVRGVPLCDQALSLRVFIRFTSFDFPLSPRLCFDCGLGFDESSSISLPLAGSGTVDLNVPIPSGARRIRFDPTDQESIFCFHCLELEPCSAADLARQDAAAKGRKFDIICFPIIDWHYRFQRPQQILSHLAEKGHRVYYISTSLGGLAPAQIRTADLAPNVFGVTLPGNSRLNLYKDAPTSTSVEKGILAFVDYLNSQSCDEAVILLHLPFWFPYAEELRRRFGWRIVYDCMDDHAGFENNTATMLSAEHQAIETSDLLVTSSQILYDKGRTYNPKCVLVRNAGDFKHFSQQIPRTESPLSHMLPPVIGYYGALAEWFDIEAVRLAASRHPEWQFALIGHVNEEKIRALSQFENVHLLGEKPYAELPSYLAGFDVCTIPFRRIPLTEATNPVKIYEYFASGKPVVARHLPELEPLSPAAALYETPEEFTALLENSLAQQSPEMFNLRREIAAINTWQDRVSMLESEMQRFLGKVSIIIVSYQSLHLLRECVQSVLGNTQYPNFELVIVDNASDKPVVEYLEKLAASSARVRVIFNSENRGFAAANNQGLQLASDSEFFVLLNNDTVTPPGWLSRLLFYARQSDIGLVGPVSNSVGNEAQIPVPYSAINDMPCFARALMHAHRGETFDIKVLAMFCVAFRREILESVGSLDESFGVGMFEDDDYAQRVRQAGYRVVCADDIFVHHYGRASFSKLSDEKYRAIFERNKQIYEKKWGPWIPHQYR